MELLLDLPNIQVQEAFEDRQGNYIVTVVSTEQGTHCYKCGKRIEKHNGYGEWITLRHLSILGKSVYCYVLPTFRLSRLKYPGVRQDPFGNIPC